MVCTYIYITKPVWSHVFGLEPMDFKKAQVVSCLEASAQITTICMLGKYFKSQMNILAPY